MALIIFAVGPATNSGANSKFRAEAVIALARVPSLRAVFGDARHYETVLLEKGTVFAARFPRQFMQSDVVADVIGGRGFGEDASVLLESSMRARVLAGGRLELIFRSNTRELAQDLANSAVAFQQRVAASEYSNRLMAAEQRLEDVRRSMEFTEASLRNFNDYWSSLASSLGADTNGPLVHSSPESDASSRSVHPALIAIGEAQIFPIVMKAHLLHKSQETALTGAIAMARQATLESLDIRHERQIGAPVSRSIAMGVALLSISLMGAGLLLRGRPSAD